MNALKQSFRTILHIAFWLAYSVVVAIVMFVALQDQDVPPEDGPYYASFILGIGFVPPIISFYAHYKFLFVRFLQKRKMWQAAGGSIAIATMATFIGIFLVFLTNDEAFGCIVWGWPYGFWFPFALCTVFGLVALMIKGFLTWFEELQLKEELLEKTHRMEMALVKSQLDPHFLFNTINNIDVLITKNPDEASRYLNKLSDIMRFMLYETKAEQIPLSTELEYIDRYIHLQKIRTANENYVNYAVEGCPERKQVAPMVFIPFIENAFKHASNKKMDGAIDIDIHIDDREIVFNCQNRFDAYRTAKNGSNGHHGLGNDLIKKRLQLLYPNRHSLAVERASDLYKVELTILNGTV